MIPRLHKIYVSIFSFLSPFSGVDQIHIWSYLILISALYTHCPHQRLSYLIVPTCLSYWVSGDHLKLGLICPILNPNVFPVNVNDVSWCKMWVLREKNKQKKKIQYWLGFYYKPQLKVQLVRFKYIDALHLNSADVFNKSNSNIFIMD